MYIAVSILIFIVCALLILIVLVQNSKGGGLSSSFASSNQIMGVRKTTDFLEKATWTLAGAMLVVLYLPWYSPEVNKPDKNLLFKSKSILQFREHRPFLISGR